jgi:hypothetical protein
MKKILFLFFLAKLSGICSLAQDLGAYSDYKGHFFIFDHGKSIKVEDFQVQSFAIGGECVLYINSQGHLKIYRNGLVSELEKGGATKYYATDHLAAYQVFDQLIAVIDNIPVTLSKRCPVYEVQDSLIVFYDESSKSLKIYYNFVVSEIESGLIGMPVTSIKSGDNIVAYISSRTKDFKIWYGGENHTILNYADRINFKAGRDVVAYTNNLDNSFHAFYKGVDYKLGEFLPKSFKVGDGFVAFVDYSGEFKVFYGGDIVSVSNYEPDGYFVEDNLLVFTEYKYFKVFCKGKIFELEGYIPANYKYDWNTLAYLDNTNRIWVFTEDGKKYLTNDLIESFNIYRDMIVMQAKVDRNIIYYKGSFYNGTSY